VYTGCQIGNCLTCRLAGRPGGSGSAAGRSEASVARAPLRASDRRCWPPLHHHRVEEYRL